MNERQLKETLLAFNFIFHAIIDNGLERSKFPKNFAQNIGNHDTHRNIHVLNYMNIS